MFIHIEPIMNKKPSIDSSGTEDLKKPKPSAAKNFMEKAIGLLGLGLLGYVAAVIAVNIAIMAAYLVLGFSYLNAIFRKDCFSDFRYHYDGLVAAPLRMLLYNGLVLPFYNTIIDVWNGFCKSTKGYDYNDNTNVSAFSFELYLNVFQNLLILIRNQFDISHFALDPYPHATFEECFTLDEEKGAPNSIRMGYFFIKGTLEWGRDLAVGMKDALVAFFSRRAIPEADNLVKASAPPIAEANLEKRSAVLSFSGDPSKKLKH